MLNFNNTDGRYGKDLIIKIELDMTVSSRWHVSCRLNDRAQQKILCKPQPNPWPYLLSSFTGLNLKNKTWITLE